MWFTSAWVSPLPYIRQVRQVSSKVLASPISFAAVQVAYAETQLTKYVLISWVGGKVKPKNKARSSPHRVLLYNQLNVLSQH